MEAEKQNKKDLKEDALEGKFGKAKTQARKTSENEKPDLFRMLNMMKTAKKKTYPSEMGNPPPLIQSAILDPATPKINRVLPFQVVHV